MQHCRTAFLKLEGTSKINLNISKFLLQKPRIKLLVLLVLKVRSHGAATARKCCHYNRIPLYLIDLFTLCGSSNSCDNGNASKWVLTPFLWLQQWQTNTVLTVICHCHKCSCEHFLVIAAEKPLHRVNGP